MQHLIGYSNDWIISKVGDSILPNEAFVLADLWFSVAGRASFRCASSCRIQQFLFEWGTGKLKK